MNDTWTSFFFTFEHSTSLLQNRLDTHLQLYDLRIWIICFANSYVQAEGVVSNILPVAVGGVAEASGVLASLGLPVCVLPRIGGLEGLVGVGPASAAVLLVERE